jgi:hypothetical protein
MGIKTLTELAAAIINSPLPVPSEANGTYDELRESGGLRSAPVPRPAGKPAGPVVTKGPTAIAKGAYKTKREAAAKLPVPPRRAPKPAAPTETAPLSPALKQARDRTWVLTPAAETADPNEPAAKPAGPSRAKTKAALVGELLSREEGCTTAECLAATGWPAIGMPAQARACGLKLRMVKEGRITRYFGSK